MDIHILQAFLDDYLKRVYTYYGEAPYIFKIAYYTIKNDFVTMNHYSEVEKHSYTSLKLSAYYKFRKKYIRETKLDSLLD